MSLIFCFVYSIKRLSIIFMFCTSIENVCDSWNYAYFLLNDKHCAWRFLFQLHESSAFCFTALNSDCSLFKRTYLSCMFPVLQSMYDILLTLTITVGTSAIINMFRGYTKPYTAPIRYADCMPNPSKLRSNSLGFYVRFVWIWHTIYISDQCSTSLVYPFRHTYNRTISDRIFKEKQITGLPILEPGTGCSYNVMNVECTLNQQRQINLAFAAYCLRWYPSLCIKLAFPVDSCFPIYSYQTFYFYWIWTRMNFG